MTPQTDKSIQARQTDRQTAYIWNWQNIATPKSETPLSRNWIVSKQALGPTLHYVTLFYTTDVTVVENNVLSGTGFN